MFDDYGAAENKRNAETILKAEKTLHASDIYRDHDFVARGIDLAIEQIRKEFFVGD